MPVPTPPPAASSRIETDSAEVRAALTHLLQLTEAHGGEMHPRLRITEHDGEMAVHADAPDGERLAKVPAALLIPIEGTEITVTADHRLEAVRHGEALSAVQRELLEVHLGLYNTTRKMAWARTMLPGVALAGPDADARHDREVLRRLRPTLLAEGRSAAEAFLGTRVLGYRAGGSGQPGAQPGGQPGAQPGAQPGTRPETQPGPRQQVLMPVIDLVNHHPGAATYNASPRSLKLAISHGGTSDVSPATTECFADYAGRFDVLDLAVRYGFVPGGVRFAGSTPAAVTVDGLSVTVAARPGQLRDVLDPPRVRVADGRLHLSHLTFHADHPQRVFTVLSMAVQMAQRTLGVSGAADELTRRIIAEVVRADADVVASVRSELRCGGAMRTLLLHALDEHTAVMARTAAAVARST